MTKEFARELRKNLTDAEQKLWSASRRKQIADCKFRRQTPIGTYIVDFVCHEQKLIIELDGGQHSDAIENDASRTRWLNSRGYRVIRFWNHEVLQDLECVLEVIYQELTNTKQSQEVE